MSIYPWISHQRFLNILEVSSYFMVVALIAIQLFVVIVRISNYSLCLLESQTGQKQWFKKFITGLFFFPYFYLELEVFWIYNIQGIVWTMLSYRTTICSVIYWLTKEKKGTRELKTQLKLYVFQSNSCWNLMNPSTFISIFCDKTRFIELIAYKIKLELKRTHR